MGAEPQATVARARHDSPEQKHEDCDEGEGNTATYDLPPGSSLKRLASDLKSLGIVRSALWFELRLRFHGMPVHAGEYEVSKELTTTQLIQLFTQGLVKRYNLTVIEGTRLDQLQLKLEASQGFQITLHSPEAIAQFLRLSQATPEGWFFPETYQYVKGMTDKQFYQKAFQLMNLKLEKAWAERDPNIQLKTPYELLIFASIIQKETSLPEEMPFVSGVLQRRLAKKMRLQTDPTVIYGLGPTFQDRLRKRDLQKDTPYNTYTRFGLPPTPIAFPGWDALWAAAHPASGNTYYFVAKGDGSHYFSATLPEHQKAVYHSLQHRLLPRYCTGLAPFEAGNGALQQGWGTLGIGCMSGEHYEPLYQF